MLLRHTFRGYQADFGLKYRSLPAIKSLRPKYSKILWLSTSLFLVLLVVPFSTINIYTKSNKFREHVLRVWRVCPAWLQPVCESVQFRCLVISNYLRPHRKVCEWPGEKQDLVMTCYHFVGFLQRLKPPIITILHTVVEWYFKDSPECWAK